MNLKMKCKKKKYMGPLSSFFFCIVSCALRKTTQMFYAKNKRILKERENINILGHRF